MKSESCTSKETNTSPAFIPLFNVKELLEKYLKDEMESLENSKEGLFKMAMKQPFSQSGDYIYFQTLIIESKAKIKLLNLLLQKII